MDYLRFTHRFLDDFIKTIPKFRTSAEFIRDNKLWLGITRYGWVAWILVILGLLIGVKFLMVFLSGFSSGSMNDPVAFASNIAGAVGDVFQEGYQLFFLGGLKYIILIFLEVIIFHFVRATIQILTGKQQAAEFKDFVAAEIRMIKVVVAAWFEETIIIFLVKLVLSIIGFSIFSPAIAIAIQCFFIGYVVMDNYFEVFGLSIKEARKQIQNRAGMAVAVGGGMYLLLMVPIAGAVIAMVLGSVTATLALHSSLPGDSLEAEPIIEGEGQLV